MPTNRPASHRDHRDHPDHPARPAPRVYVHQIDGAGTLRALPLAAGLLVSSARQDPALAEATFEILTARRSLHQTVAGYQRPDILAFSLYAWNLRYSLELARQAREAFPDVWIVAGGPSVPRRPPEVERFLGRHPELDAVVIGEGETAFRELLRARSSGHPLEEIEGLAYRGPEGRVRRTPARARARDLGTVLSPYLDGTFDSLVDDREWPAALLETNRGCPFSCTFCDWGAATGDQVVDRPLEQVLDELTWIADHAIPTVYIVDANFGMRRRDPEIAEHIATLRASTGYPTTCYFHLTKTPNAVHLDLAETLLEAEVGCSLGLSVQDFDRAVLAAIRRTNIDGRRLADLRRRCSERGIPSYNELMLGLPRQSYDTFADTVVAAASFLPGDSFFVYPCRLIGNAEMAEPSYRARFQLETRSCPWRAPGVASEPIVEELQEVVVASRHLPVSEWRRAYRFGYLCSAVYNHGLLRDLMRLVGPVLGGDLRAWLEQLEHSMRLAPEGSVLAELDEALERHVRSILSGGPMVLPVDGAGPLPREPCEAVAITALARQDELFDELGSLTNALAVAAGIPDSSMEEAVLFQRFVTPQHGRDQARERPFDHDWLSWRRSRGTSRPVPVETTLRFDPPPYTGARSYEAFVGAHLAACYDKQDIGRLAHAQLPHRSSLAM